MHETPLSSSPAILPAVPHLQWRAEALWQQLSAQLPGLSVEVLARAESTNSLLLERARVGGGRHDAPITTPGELEAQLARGDDGSGPYGRRAGDTHPCLLVAEHQTLGRGRQGRSWQSSAGASLTFSLGLPLAPKDWSGLSLAVGVVLADALDPAPPQGAARLQLKWPNDLWLADGPGRGRKLGGVLIETVAVGRRRMVVIGVGLNVLPQATRDLSSGYGCLLEIDPAATAPGVLHRVALPLVQALRRFEREGFAGFKAAYERRDLLRGCAVSTVDAALPQGVLEGRVEGVTGSGALLLRCADNTLHLISSGDVSVRLQDGGPGTADDGASAADAA